MRIGSIAVSRRLLLRRRNAAQGFAPRVLSSASMSAQNTLTSFRQSADASWNNRKVSSFALRCNASWPAKKFTSQTWLFS